MNTLMKLSKKYDKPTITTIILDNEISLILSSDCDGGYKNHKPGCPCRHCNPDKNDENYYNESPFN